MSFEISTHRTPKEEATTDSLWKAVVQHEHTGKGVWKAPSRSISQAGLEEKSDGLNPVRASSEGSVKDREPGNCSVVPFGSLGAGWSLSVRHTE